MVGFITRRLRKRDALSLVGRVSRLDGEPSVCTMYLRGCSGSPGVVWCGCVMFKLRRVEGGGSHCGTSEVAGGGGCEMFKFRRVEGGGIEGDSRFRLELDVDCFFLFFELWIEGLVLPFVRNSDNGGTSEVAGGGD